jgi:single-stranded-DNA-specific exonuclease
MPAFLDVESSFTGRAWRARLDAAGEARAQAIAQLSGEGELLARVLAGRGVNVEEVERFLDPTIRDLMPDPDTLAGMKAATERLVLAVEGAERVAIFGDYDVDGACSAALLSEYLQGVGCETLTHIPDRILEGYGPNNEAMEAFKAQGAGLVVTVDCGAVSHGPIAHARAQGLDVVVFDHHQAPEMLPDAVAIVDPNRQDDLSGLGYLCAAGVVFMGLVALNRSLRERGFFTRKKPPDLMASLDLVALATVADVVPLVGLNRAFVTRGLEVMKRRARPGLAALFDVAGADGPPRAYHLGYLVGPRINAGGRIGDAGLGARLLTVTDELKAREIAAELDRLNRARQQIEQAALAEAEAEALASLGLEERGATVAGRRESSGSSRRGSKSGSGAPPSPSLWASPRRPVRGGRSPGSTSVASFGPESRPGSRSRAAGMRWRRASPSRAKASATGGPISNRNSPFPSRPRGPTPPCPSTPRWSPPPRRRNWCANSRPPVPTAPAIPSRPSRSPAIGSSMSFP